MLNLYIKTPKHDLSLRRLMDLAKIRTQFLDNLSTYMKKEQHYRRDLIVFHGTVRDTFNFWGIVLLDPRLKTGTLIDKIYNAQSLDFDC
jgi:hypothetical protein